MYAPTSTLGGDVDPTMLAAAVADGRVLLNEGGGASESNQFSSNPAFVLGPFPVDGDAAEAPAGGDIVAVAPAEVQTHNNGTQVELRSVTFEGDASTVTFAVRNGHDREVTLNDPGDSYLLDDGGDRYPLLDPADDPELTVEPGGVREGTLVFAGRVRDDASSFSLLLNEGGGASLENQFTRAPGFVFGPYPLERAPPAVALENRPQGAAPLRFGLRTAVGEAALAASLVEAAAIIAGELGGTETDEGIVVTVPDDVLFDFDSADLRPGADATVADLATLLEFYPDAAARVLGHTDSRGSDAYNLDLSDRRAAAVLDAMVADHGIDPARLTAEGRGEAEPVAPNEGSDGSDDPAGRQQNRRVELVIDTDQPLPG